MIFYKETEFQETPIGKIPKDWELVKFSNIAEDIYYGITAKAVENKTGLKMLRTTDIKNYSVDWDSLPFCEVTEKRGDIQRFLLKKGDLIIARAGTTGVSVLVEKDFENVIFGSYLIKVRLSRKVHPKFMHYFCQSHLYWDHITSGQAGSTLKNINLPILKSLNIPLPSLVEEQRAIAEILSTVDEAIQRTDEIIAKTERLKKGLMQELLTKGIGHKEFKDTEIGRIPKEWEVVKLKEVVSEAKSGFACGKRDENGILQLRMDNIEPEGWINVEAGVKVPIPEGVEDYILKPGDILFNNTNSIDLIGKTAIFRGEFSRCVYSNHLTRIRVDRNKVVPEWVLYLLIRKWKLGVFKAICHRHVHQAGINNEDLLRLKIPLPSLQEQQKITLIIMTIDNKLKLEKEQKARLERIKQCLMDLLLTGKVRVRIEGVK
jgi:type I restriction enzyme S subunit